MEQNGQLDSLAASSRIKNPKYSLYTKWLGPEVALRNLEKYLTDEGARGSEEVKALCCKPEGCRFDTRWGDFLNLPNPYGRTRPWSLLSL
jgi:hypothetical protein